MTTEERNIHEGLLEAQARMRKCAEILKRRADQTMLSVGDAKDAHAMLDDFRSALYMYDSLNTTGKLPEPPRLMTASDEAQFTRDRQAAKMWRTLMAHVHAFDMEGSAGSKVLYLKWPENGHPNRAAQMTLEEWLAMCAFTVNKHG
jgi:hypothetical protein